MSVYLRLIRTTARRLTQSGVLVTPLLTFCIALLLPALAAASTNVWAGVGIVPWSNPANWSLGTVADGSTDILIDQGGVRGDFSFTLKSGNTFTLKNDPTTLFLLSTTTITNSGVINLSARITGGSLVNNKFIEVIGTGLLRELNVTQGPGGMIDSGGSSTLVLDGATVTGGSLGRGRFTGQNGAVLKDLQIASLGTVTLTAGSTFGIEGMVTNRGVGLGDGVRLTGSGTLVNANLGQIAALMGQAVIGVKVTQQGSGEMEAFPGATLVLDGATVTGGSLGRGRFTGQNGAVLKDLQLASLGTVTLTDGSILALQGTVMNVGNLELGTSGIGATLNGGGTLVNSLFNTEIRGGGTLNLPIVNNGRIIVDNPVIPLVLRGNVSNPKATGSIAVRGGTLTLDSVTVNTQIVGVDPGSKLNGIGTINVSSAVQNAGTLSPGLGAPGLLTINGIYRQSANAVFDVLLGGGKPGQFSELDVNGFVIFDTQCVVACSGSTIKAEFFDNFNPASDCSTISTICDSFDILRVTNGSISGFSSLTFDLPSLPDGLTWLVLDQNDRDIVLEVTGSVSTPVPEPGSVFLLGTGLIAIGYCARRCIFHHGDGA